MQNLDVAAAVDFIKACKNFDGGFGCTPGNTAPTLWYFTVGHAMQHKLDLTNCAVMHDIWAFSTVSNSSSM
jgi:prenyltransferase beta subunit